MILRQTNWHRANPNARGVEDRVCDCWRNRNNRRFSGAGGRQIRPVKQVDVQLGDILKPRDLVFAERWIEHFTLLELHLLPQRRSQPHDHGALHLGQQVVRIQNGATLEDFAHAPHGNFVLLAVDLNLRARGDIRAFLGAAGQTDAPVPTLFLHALLPIELFRSRLEHGPQARIFQVRQPELERVSTGGRGQFVHEALAAKVVGRCRQRSI